MDYNAKLPLPADEEGGRKGVGWGLGDLGKTRTCRVEGGYVGTWFCMLWGIGAGAIDCILVKILGC